MTCHKSLLIGLLGGLAACAETPPATPMQTAMRSPTELARNVIAEQLGVESTLVEITAIEDVEFSDASLGCPRPGMAYAQVLTPGQRIIGRYADKEFDVRVSGSRALICDSAISRAATQRSSY